MSRTTVSAKPAKRSAERATARRPHRSNHGGTGWAKLDAMTDEEVMARAFTDADNLAVTSEGRKRMRPGPRAYAVRRAFQMTQEEFAEAFRIPIGTLRDWEQGRTEPDQANQAYLRVIAVAPEVVRRALALRPGETMSDAR